jgi:hypothetical protein
VGGQESLICSHVGLAPVTALIEGLYRRSPLSLNSEVEERHARRGRSQSGHYTQRTALLLSRCEQ